MNIAAQKNRKARKEEIGEQMEKRQTADLEKVRAALLRSIIGLHFKKCLVPREPGVSV